MTPEIIWLMAIGMGVYQGLHPPMGWFMALSRGLENRSWRSVFGGTWPFALGHLLSMLVVLLPIAVVLSIFVPLYMMLLMYLTWVTSFGLIGCGVYKLIKPEHSRFIARIRPNKDIRWSFWMGMTHCLSPIMMIPMLIDLVMLNNSSFMGYDAPRLLIYSMLAVALSLVMVVPLILVATATALTVFMIFRLFGTLRYWLNLDLGWAAMFIAMGVMGFAHGIEATN
ncbi:hypothetical protein [Acidithiobacillus ferrianus]|uniref:hypothetical protein n=1 Tax=Acidithiobacillus ferrianus TaxID=2678518 RepID=UPI0034E452A7